MQRLEAGDAEDRVDGTPRSQRIRAVRPEHEELWGLVVPIGRGDLVAVRV